MFLKYQEKSYTIIVYGKGTYGSPMTPPFIVFFLVESQIGVPGRGPLCGASPHDIAPITAQSFECTPWLGSGIFTKKYPIQMLYEEFFLVFLVFS
jgi:hypothetical protein